MAAPTTSRSKRISFWALLLEKDEVIHSILLRVRNPDAMMTSPISMKATPLISAITKHLPDPFYLKGIQGVTLACVFPNAVWDMKHGFWLLISSVLLHLPAILPKGKRRRAAVIMQRSYLLFIFYKLLRAKY